MDKKQADRRPDEQSGAQGDRKTADPGRRMPEDKGLGRKPEGQPIDKPLPQPGHERKDRGLGQDERSDRESGRPVQLEEGETPAP